MLQIDRKNDIPIYQQIYEQIKSDILTGRLPVDAGLTSTRALANELQIGRNSVENAYEQLRLEGYITSIPGSGYIVNNLEFDLNQHPPKKEKRSRSQIKQAIVPINTINYSFQYGEIDGDIFPKRLWRTYIADLLDEPQAKSVHEYGDGKGDFQLRQQLKQYLYLSRGVKCETEQIILCSGAQSALEIIIRIFSGEKTVALENPCYDGTKAVFQSNGFKILPVPVREDGIDLQCLLSLKAPMVHIAPSHQFPTGAVMPINKRMEILSLAYKRDMLIIEDDYDSEFRYKGRPIPSLQSIDQAGCVIYVGTLSKALSPGLRMAYLVLPAWLLPAYQEKYKDYQCTIPVLEQKALSRFMQEGNWQKHIRRICLSQKKKHDILIAAIQQIMGRKVQVYGGHAGMHVWLEIPGGQQEEALVKKALDCGVEVHPASPFWLDKNNYKGNAVVLGYGKIKEKDIVPAIELLNKAWFE